MKTIIWVTTQFVAFHRWRAAPEEVSFLRVYHRHIFKVKMGVLVQHLNREVEFFTLKKELEEYIHLHYSGLEFGKSCELIATEILEVFDAYFVQVSEDGENGALVEKE